MGFTKLSVSYNLLALSLAWLVSCTLLISLLSSLKRVSFLWPIFFIILLISFLVNNLLMFYVFFEMSLIPIIAMIIFWGNQPERLSASLYLIIYTGFVSLPFLAMVLSKQLFFFSFKNLETSSMVMLMMSAPFLVKMPILGFHFWLPKAHVEASTSGSMVLAGILLKLGSYGVCRLLALLAQSQLKLLVPLWLFLTLLSSVLTFSQSDLKKIIAYSSVTHMTFMMLGLVSYNWSTVFTILLLSLAHGWAAMALFASAGSVSMGSSSRLGILVKSEEKFHWFSLVVGASVAANMALPPLPSFFCELMLAATGFILSFFIFSFILLSLVICYYNVYIYTIISHSKSLESKVGKFSQNEVFKQCFMTLGSVVSLLWALFL